MSEELAILFAKRFIQRRDIKAIQLPRVGNQVGAYVPDRSMKHLGKHGPLGFTMDHLYAHLAGTATYGHYLLDDQNQARMFCLDIDLNKTGWYLPTEPGENWEQPVQLGNPDDDDDESLRLAWHDRAHPARGWLKVQMGMLARRFTRLIQDELGIPTAAAYSGNKGIHVYGFTGPQDAAMVRRACLHILKRTGEWAPIKGEHFWGNRVADPRLGYQNFTIETYPKQDTLDGKDLGNLIRLPLGRNLKHPDPTFFMDLNTPPGVMQPHADPVALLTGGDPYA